MADTGIGMGSLQLEEVGKDHRSSLLANPELDEQKERPKVRSDSDGPPPMEVGAGIHLKPNQRYTWDFVFVFEVGDAEKTIAIVDEDTGEKKEVNQVEHFRAMTADTVRRLENAGVKTDLYLSVQEDEVYCRVGVPESRLEDEAERIEYDVEMDPFRLKEACNFMGLPIVKATADPEFDDVDDNIWHHVYGKFTKYDREHSHRYELPKMYNDELGMRVNSRFSAIDRLKLSVAIIEADLPLGGAGISMTRAIDSPAHPMIAFYPLHQMKLKSLLQEKWYQWGSAFSCPLDEVRSYFGEAVAMYFGFLQFYNVSLIFPAIFGILFFVWQIIEQRIDVEGIAVFALGISVWSAMFLEMWKRKEASYRVRWGMTEFIAKEQARPEFEGQWRQSPIDGHRIEYFPALEKLKRIILGQAVVWSLIAVVITSVVGIFVIRKILVDWNPTLGTYLTGAINAVQIQVLNAVYGIVAFKLNDYENYRTDSEYQNALIAKTFLFKFINSYNSLIYIAFFKKHDRAVNGCDGGNCLTELAQQLGTIFIVAIIIGNTLEIVVPMLTNWWTERQNQAEPQPLEDDGSSSSAPLGGSEMTQAEKEFNLSHYDGTFDDFDELIIQYGYVTLFVVAFPLTPMLALLNNIVEMRVDSSKLCEHTRRPEPRGAYDIGTWFDILNIMSFLAVVINTAIVCFETELMNEWVDGDAAMKAYIFIGVEHTIILLKFAVDYWVPDEPEVVTMHKSRQQYLMNVLINGVMDVEDGVVKPSRKASMAGNRAFNWNARVSKKMHFTGREWSS